MSATIATSQQLARAAAKRRWDPEGRFSNRWYARYAPALTG